MRSGHLLGASGGFGVNRSIHLKQLKSLQKPHTVLHRCWGGSTTIFIKFGALLGKSCDSPKMHQNRSKFVLWVPQGLYRSCMWFLMCFDFLIWLDHNFSVLVPDHYFSWVFCLILIQMEFFVQVLITQVWSIPLCLSMATKSIGIKDSYLCLL